MQAGTATEHVYRYTLRSPLLLAFWALGYLAGFASAVALNIIFPPHRAGVDTFIVVGMLIGMCA